MSSVMNDKQRLRQMQKQRQQALPASTRQTQADDLYQQLWTSTAWQKSQTVALTLSLPFELDTQPLIKAAWQSGKRVVVPQIKQHRMFFVVIHPTTDYQVGSLGILTPVATQVWPAEQIDLVIVPGLAFTNEGQRLGFGGGYYDHFLRDYRGTTVALALSLQLVAILPNEAHDQPIQMIMTISH